MFYITGDTHGNFRPINRFCASNNLTKEAYIDGIDQSTVDKSTELWLDEIEKKLSYRKWYCGHWHIEKRVGKLQFMFGNIEPFELG